MRKLLGLITGITLLTSAVASAEGGAPDSRWYDDAATATRTTLDTIRIFKEGFLVWRPERPLAKLIPYEEVDRLVEVINRSVARASWQFGELKDLGMQLKKDCGMGGENFTPTCMESSLRGITLKLHDVNTKAEDQVRKLSLAESFRALAEQTKARTSLPADAKIAKELGKVVAAPAPTVVGTREDEQALAPTLR